MRRRLALLAIVCPVLGLALPQGGKGPADFTTSGERLDIKTHDTRSIITWDSFSIDFSEQVKITQPDASCTVFNDVLGGESSHLMGLLESNANVYIVNPNGIIIGKDAVIDVGSLVASTLSLTHDDFLKGNDSFKASSFAEVKILGTVQACSGDITVLGSDIENRGKLLAPNGSATLCSADHVILQPKGKKILIKTANPRASKDAREVKNSGVIEALQTQLCGDGSVYQLAINHSGIIRATQIEQREGRVYLTAEGGKIEVSGKIEASGGSVEAFAKHIAVDQEAVIDVSHNQQAGTIYLGGYRDGLGSSFLADQTYLGPNASLKAVGLDSGSAGEIVVWGDLKAHVCGMIDARGGLKGGVIEISKSPYLSSFQFYTAARYEEGKHGELILDPPNVTITTSDTTGNGQVVVTSGNYSFDAYSPATNPLNINIDDLNSVLESNHVTINVSNGNSTATDDGNITIGSAGIISDAAFINPSSGAFNLTLTAGENGTIQVNKGITVQGSLTMRAKSLLLGNASNTHANAININAATGISFTGTGTSGVLGVYTGTGNSGDGKQASIESAGTITLSEATGADVQISVRSAAVADGKTPADAFIRSTKSSGTAISATIGAIAVESEGAAASIEGAGDVALAHDGDVSVHIFGSGEQAFIRSTGGSLTLTEAGSSNLSLNNDSSNVNSQAYISAANQLDITCLGNIDLRLSTAGLQTYLKGDQGLEIHDCANLNIECASDHVGASSVVSIESDSSSSGIDIACRGTVTVQSLNEGNARIHSESGGIRLGSDASRIAGLVLNAATEDAMASLWAEGGGNIEVYGASSSSALSQPASSSQGPKELSQILSEPEYGNTSIIASEILIDGASVTAAAGDLLCISDGDMTLGDGASLVANASTPQSIILACGQTSTLAAPSSLTIGSDVSLLAGGTTDSSGKLRVFSIDFGSNTINREANLNTGTFSGEPGVQDAHNFYDISYNPSSLPTQYNAPYTFYYRGYNPPSPPTPSVHPDVQQGIFAIISTLIPSRIISMDSGRSTLSNVIQRSQPSAKASDKTQEYGSRKWKTRKNKKTRSKGLRRPK